MACTSIRSLRPSWCRASWRPTATHAGAAIPSTGATGEAGASLLLGLPVALDTSGYPAEPGAGGGPQRARAAAGQSPLPKTLQQRPDRQLLELAVKR